MQTYILRRLLMIVPTLIGVTLIVFAIMHVLPGDVAAFIATRGGEGTATPQQIEELRQKLGLDKSLIMQYVDWVGGLVRLDAGTSLWSGKPVMEELLQRLPLTVELALLSMVIALGISIPIGVLSARRQDTWVDYFFRVVSIGGLAIPNFWLGALVILGLSVWFGWIPPLGYASIMEDPLKNLQQLIWPAVIMGYRMSAVTSRMTRSTMLDVLREDYIRTAWAKGLQERAVVYRHALKNALLPVITMSAMQFAGLLGGVVIMESIFSLPGLGRFLIDSISQRDYPVVQAIVLLMAIKFAVINLVVDILYAWLNPRIHYT